MSSPASASFTKLSVDPDKFVEVVLTFKAQYCSWEGIRFVNGLEAPFGIWEKEEEKKEPHLEPLYLIRFETLLVAHCLTESRSSVGKAIFAHAE